MSKKDFKGGLSSLLGDQPAKPKRGRPQTSTREVNVSSQQGTKENETRATFIINEELLDKLKAIAYWDRILIKEVVNSALLEYVNKKNPQPRPEEVRKKDQEATQRQIKTHGNRARLPRF
jgi:hypothetical protein